MAYFLPNLYFVLSPIIGEPPSQSFPLVVREATNTPALFCLYGLRINEREYMVEEFLCNIESSSTQEDGLWQNEGILRYKPLFITSNFVFR